MKIIKGFMKTAKRNLWLDIAFLAGGALVGLVLRYVHLVIIPQLF